MENAEIFLNKYLQDNAVYAETAEKLGIDAAVVSDADRLAEYLIGSAGEKHYSLYISDDEYESAAVSMILGVFEKLAGKVKYDIIVDEFLMILDSEGHITDRAKPRSLIHRDGDLHLAVHVWIIKRKDMGIYALLQKRSDDKTIHPGCYDVSAAGHVDQGEEFRATAVRETMEELGLRIHGSKLEFLKHHRCSYVKGDIHDNELRAIYICRENLDTESLVLQSSEVSDVCWVEIDELMAVMDDISFAHCLDPEELMILKKAVF